MKRHIENLETKLSRVRTSSEAPAPTILPHQSATLISLETLTSSTQEPAHSSNISSPATQPVSSEHPDASTRPPVSERYVRQKFRHVGRSPRNRTEWETVIGGQLYNRIGAAAIVVGVGFFLKYAFDNDLISEPVRILLGIIAGGGLLIVGEHLHKRTLAQVAQGVTGAGIGILYTAMYAAYNLYYLIPAFQALAGMIAVTIIGFVLALRYNSRVIAILSWFGGYITPVLVHSNQPNPLGLFTYLLILSAGMLLLALQRNDWFILHPLSLIAAYSICGIWYINAYTTMQHFGITVTFAGVFWLLFASVDIYRTLRGLSYTDTQWRRRVSFLPSALSYIALFILVSDPYPRWMPLVSLCYGIFYCCAGYIAQQREPRDSFSFERYISTAIIQFVLVPAQHFDSVEYTLIVWSIESVVLLWLGMYWQQRFIVLAGMLVSMLTLIQGVFLYTVPLPTEQQSSHLFGLPLVMYMCLAGTFATAGRLEQKATLTLMHMFPRVMASAPAILAHTSFSRIGFALALIRAAMYELWEFRQWNLEQSISYSDYWYSMLGASVLCWTGFTMLWAARRWRWHEPAWIGAMVIGLASLSLVINGFAYDPATAWSFLLNIRAGSILLGTAGVVASWFLMDTQQQSFSESTIRITRRAVGTIVFALILSLCSGEASDIFHSQIMQLYTLPDAIQRNTTITDKIERLENAKQLAISLVWLIYATILMILGFIRRVRLTRLAALGLSGIAILKIVLYDLSYLSTLYRIGSFIGLGIVLLLVSYLYQRFKSRIF
ncbi:MAG: DUF2339 domain-containing protein [Bacteroidota bacterium]|nr:DUF2339 domain-containing protein [Bacteroidota bacterium]